METEINNDFQIVFSEESQSDSTIRCHLSPEISAVDMEIRWFKETECVCFYKNTRLIEGESYKGIMRLCIEELERGIVSLQLKNVRESYVGDYLCQVTRGNRTAEISIRKSLKTNDEVPQKTTKWCRQIDKIWTDEERIKMANSALLAVFNRLEKTDAPKEDLQGVNEMETSTCKWEEQEAHLVDQQPGFSSQKLPDSDVKICIFRNGKTNGHYKDFTHMLQSRIENLREVPTVDESDVILVFCPVVSRAGTDINKALERFTGKTETKLAVLVVLHHTFDPEKPSQTAADVSTGQTYSQWTVCSMRIQDY
ncbi:uncharacterized protein LOC131541143 isoform X2 [Onychostoma macrolepis]|nr:uncharacterized protein LOC131541143 isoform X2 [Onychostoma macrolepis]